VETGAGIITRSRHTRTAADEVAQNRSSRAFARAGGDPHRAHGWHDGERRCMPLLSTMLNGGHHRVHRRRVAGGASVSGVAEQQTAMPVLETEASRQQMTAACRRAVNADAVMSNNADGVRQRCSRERREVAP
jgi:hypothetical protein